MAKVHVMHLYKGANVQHLFSIGGQMSTPVNPCIPFFIGGGGADVRGGKCPTLHLSVKTSKSARS